MTAFVRRTTRSVRPVRTSIEVAVVLAGVLLGGTLGIATAVYVVTIGPLTRLLVPYLLIRLPGDARDESAVLTGVRHHRGVDLTSEHAPGRDAEIDAGQIEEANDAEIDDATLEQIAALGWPGLEQHRMGDWLLRASGGFTGRGNSVLPVGDPGRPIDDAIDAVVDWYGERGLPPMAQVPLPLCAGLDDELDRRGWRAFNRSHVLVGPLGLLLHPSARKPLPAVELEPSPSPVWLSGYHYRGAALPDGAAAVLAAGGEPVFASIVLEGDVVAVGRGIVDEGWLGVTAVTVVESHRRLGLGSAIMAKLAGWAAERGARSVYLQVASENTAALQMYDRLGMSRHHAYQYRRLDD